MNFKNSSKLKLTNTLYNKYIWVYLLLCSLFSVSVVTNNISPYILIYSIGIILVLIISPFNLKFTLIMIAFGLSIRLILSFLIPHIIIYDDELGYTRMARDTVLGWLLDEKQLLIKNAWANVVAVLFFLFDDSISAVKAFNNIVGIITAFVLCRIAQKIYKDNLITICVLISSLFLPPNMLISSIVLKEQFMAFLLVLLLYTLVCHQDGLSLIHFGVISYLFILFRSSVGYMLLFPLGIIKVIKIYNLKSNLGVVKQVILIFFLSISIFVIIVNYSKIKNIKSHSIQFVLGEDKRGLKTLTNSSAKYTQFIDKKNLFSIKNIVLIPLRCLFSPSPLRPLKNPQKAVYLESLMITSWLYIGMPFFILGAFFSIRSLTKMIPVILFVLIFLMASLSILSYAPETLRFMLQGIPIFFMVAIYGYFISKKTFVRKVVLSLWIFSIVTFNVVYIVL